MVERHEKSGKNPKDKRERKARPRLAACFCGKNPGLEAARLVVKPITPS